MWPLHHHFTPNTADPKVHTLIPIISHPLYVGDPHNPASPTLLSFFSTHASWGLPVSTGHLSHNIFQTET